jgi:hypothetical protein
MAAEADSLAVERGHAGFCGSPALRDQDFALSEHRDGADFFRTQLLRPLGAVSFGRFQRRQAARRHEAAEHDLAQRLVHLVGHLREQADLGRNRGPQFRLQRFIGRRRYLDERRFTFSAASVHAIQDQAVHLDVQVGGRTEALSEREGAAAGVGCVESSLPKHVRVSTCA